MKAWVAAVVLSLSVFLGGPALSQATHAYTTASTKISELLADPQARAIIDKYLPGLSTDRRIALVGSRTLRELQRYVPGITDRVLGEIDADLAAARR